MKILSNAAYKKLKRDADWAESTVESNQDKIKDLKREIKELEELTTDNSNATKRKHKLEVTELNTKITELETELNAVIKNSGEQQKIKDLTVKLDIREKILKAKEEGFKTLETEIAALAVKVEKAKQSGYKEGYADGVADGIRKGTDLTADDRRMMAQVALIAAASHTPEAAVEIAKEVGKQAKNVLTSTTGESNRKTK